MLLTGLYPFQAVHNVFSQDQAETPLGRAYSFYLLGMIDSAVVYYTMAKETGSKADSYYGLMNCFLVMKRYDDVISTGMEAPGGSGDFFIQEKIARAYALQNKVSIADSIFKRTMEIASREKSGIPEYVTRDFVLSMGNSFLDRKNYEKAEEYFRRGDNLFGTGEFKAAIENLKKLEKDRIKLQANLYGGLIDYRKAENLDHGSYAGISTGILFFNTNLLTAGYASLLINREYSEVKKPQKPQELADLYEHDFHFIYTNYYQIIPNTRLQFGLQAGKSNIEYSDNLKTFILNHITSIGRFSWGSYLYYTILNEHNVAQASPCLSINLRIGNGSAELKAVTNMIKPFAVTAEESTIPGSIQFSWDLGLRLKLNQVCLSIAGNAGRRAFLFENESLVLINETDRFLYGGKILIEYSLSGLPLTLYSQLRYSHFKTYNSFSAMGGIFIEW